MSSQDTQETTRATRRSLKTLQHTESGTESLVGRPSKNLKIQLTQETNSIVQSEPVDMKTKNQSTKETQVNLDRFITIDDLTNPEGPSEKYWQILSEKRQTALQEALEENKNLHKIIQDLKEENTLLKQMLDEANSFVEVIKEELGSDGDNDTGIDVNDVSTADETAEETKYP